MSIKILTQNSIEVTNIDGARENNFTAGNRSGIIKGAFNEGNLFSASSNVIALDSCELLISGHRVVIDSAEAITLTNRPATNTRYSLVAEIVVDNSSTPTFRLFIQNSNTILKQDNLFKTQNGAGTYQIEIGKFTLTTSGAITDIVRTIDLIMGGRGDIDAGVINIGNIVTNTLDAGMEAEFDVEQRYDEDTKKTYTDFTVSIPEGRQPKPNTLQIGSVTSGETANATITGDAPNQILNLVLPRGERGEQGEQGVSGTIVADNVAVTSGKTSTTISKQYQLSGLTNMCTLTLETKIAFETGKFYTIEVKTSNTTYMTFSGVYSSLYGTQNVAFLGLDANSLSGCSIALCIRTFSGDLGIVTHRDIFNGYLATDYRVTVREY